MNAKDLSDISKSMQQLGGTWGKCPASDERSAAGAFRVGWAMAEANGEFCVPANDAGGLLEELDRACASSSNKEFRLWLGTMTASLKQSQ